MCISLLQLFFCTYLTGWKGMLVVSSAKNSSSNVISSLSSFLSLQHLHNVNWGFHCFDHWKIWLINELYPRNSNVVIIEKLFCSMIWSPMGYWRLSLAANTSQFSLYHHMVTFHVLFQNLAIMTIGHCDDFRVKWSKSFFTTRPWEITIWWFRGNTYTYCI